MFKYIGIGIAATLVLWIGAHSLRLLFSDSDYENYRQEKDQCQEILIDKFDMPCLSIEDCIAIYDFVSARRYLGCHPSQACFDQNSQFIDCSTSSKKRSPYLDDKRSIVQSEIAFYIRNNELEKAEITAREADMYYLFENYNKN
jgi:hypothetical protein